MPSSGQVRSDPILELTPRHRQVLATIATAGAARDKLGDLATSREMSDLIDAGLVTYEPIILGETKTGPSIDGWYLTPSGAVATGLNPDFLRGAPN